MSPPEPCPGRDPYCPCQDGDVCHYRDIPGSPGWPIPAPNPPKLAAAQATDALLAELDRLQQEEWQANLASLEGIEISQ